MKQLEPCNDCGKTHPFFECDKPKPMTNEERIKADAEHNEKVFEDTMQRILNVASWADDPYKSTLRRVVSTAKEQWKSGKGKEVGDD